MSEIKTLNLHELTGDFLNFSTCPCRRLARRNRSYCCFAVRARVQALVQALVLVPTHLVPILIGITMSRNLLYRQRNLPR